MKLVELITKNSKSKILIGESIKNLNQYIPLNTIVITDKNVNRLYGKYFNEYPIIKIESGEQSKSFETIEKICKELIKLNADRNTFLLGVGGGVVSDITGFVASIYKRGLRFGFVSTTFLGQIDAAIGGKNGINYRGTKNVIGTINQPEFILSDFATLQTLSKKEIINGIAELIKTALVADAKLFTIIEKNYNKIIELDHKILKKVIYSAVKIKSEIVQKDEKENGLRRILNFGHSFGHAIESTTMFTSSPISSISHGEAISIGMLKAMKLSIDKIKLNQVVLERTMSLFENVGLPLESIYDKNTVEKAIMLDKKKYNDKIKFVLLEDIGKPVIKEIAVTELREYL